MRQELVRHPPPDPSVRAITAKPIVKDAHTNALKEVVHSLLLVAYPTVRPDRKPEAGAGHLRGLRAGDGPPREQRGGPSKSSSW